MTCNIFWPIVEEKHKSREDLSLKFFTCTIFFKYFFSIDYATIRKQMERIDIMRNKKRWESTRLSVDYTM